MVAGLLPLSLLLHGFPLHLFKHIVEATELPAATPRIGGVVLVRVALPVLIEVVVAVAVLPVLGVVVLVLLHVLVRVNCSVPVVLFSLLLVRQNFVRVDDLSVVLGGFRLLVFVWVVLARQLVKRLLDCLRGGILVHSQNFVEIFLTDCHLNKREKEEQGKADLGETHQGRLCVGLKPDRIERVILLLSFSLSLFFSPRKN